MKINKSRLVRIIKEELEKDSEDASDMRIHFEDLIEDFNNDPGHETESGFFLSLLRESGGKFLSPREENYN